VIGTNFSTIPSANSVTINGRYAQVTTSTATQLQFVVPQSIATGKIKVITANGAVTSAGYYVVPPAPLLAADVVSVTTAVVDGANGTATVPTAGKGGIVLFEGVAGQRLGIGVHTFTVSPAGAEVYVSVRDPENNVIVAESSSSTSPSFVGTTGGTIDVPTLVKSGTYSIVWRPAPNASATGSGTFTVSTDLSGTLTVDAAATSININRKGRNARYTFSATAGDRVSAVIAGSTVTTGGTIKIIRPIGADLISNTFGAEFSLDTGPLPDTGTYTIFVSPTRSETGTFNLSVAKSKTSAITINGSSLNISLIAGQNSYSSFAGTAGDDLSIGLTGVTYTPTTYPISVAVLDPTGATFFTNCGTDTLGATCILPRLITTGTYQIVVDPAFAATASLTLTLSRALASTAVPNPVTPAAISIARAGQYARHKVTATAGQNLGLGVSSLVLTPVSVTYAVVRIYRPDGTLLGTSNCYVSNNGCSSNVMRNLVAGDYFVTITPQNAATAAFNIQVNSDLTGVLAAGAQTTLNLKSGQNATYTFNGTLNQNVALEFVQTSTVPAGRTVNVYVFRPTDIVDPYDNYFNGPWRTMPLTTSGTLALPPLPVAGVYAVIVDTSYSESATTKLTLDTGIPLTINAATTTSASIATAGETAFFTIATSAGQNLGIALSELTLSPAASALIPSIFKPDGSPISTIQFCNPTGCAMDIINTVAGQYAILLSPNNSATGTFKMLVNTDVTGALTSGATSAISLKAGQNGRYTFTGTLNQIASLEFSQLVTVPAGRTIQAFLYRPSDVPNLNVVGSSTITQYTSAWQTLNIPPTGVTTVFPALPETGTYLVVLNTVAEESATLNGVFGNIDLAASAVSIGAITKNTDNSYTFPVTFTVTNVGTVTARTSWYDTVYLSADTALDNADQNFSCNNVRNTALAPAAAYTVTLTCTTTTTTTAGAYKVIVRTDGTGPSVTGTANTAAGTIAEANETNNVVSVAVTLP
jgi:large repetitive protein